MDNKPRPLSPEGQLLIYQDGALRVQVRIDGETVWLTQRLMADLYQVTVANINQHLKTIYEEGELSPEATIKQFLIVQTEGNRRVSRMVDHYNLDAFILTHAGRISQVLAEERAHAEFEKYDAQRRKLEATTPTSDFDRFVEKTRQLTGKDRKKLPGPQKPERKRRDRKK